MKRTSLTTFSILFFVFALQFACTKAPDSTTPAPTPAPPAFVYEVAGRSVLKYGKLMVNYGRINKAGTKFCLLYIDSASLPKFKEATPMADSTILLMETYLHPDTPGIVQFRFKSPLNGGIWYSGEFQPNTPDFTAVYNAGCTGCHSTSMGASSSDFTFTFPMFLYGLQKGAKPIEVTCPKDFNDPCTPAVYQGQ